MKYQDFIHFDPITDIIQLRESKDKNVARQLVRTYVISDTMQARLTDKVFKQLDDDNPEEHFGMLIVGNYGTGKSHLMSFVASIAADAELVSEIKNEKVREEAKRIAGKFNVMREEIGGVTASFRSIFVRCLQKHLDEVGVDFSIPVEDNEITNNKEWMVEMMKAYHQKFPEKGLLFVLDEMLDYLRGLHDRELVLAFGLMREIGEFSNMRDDEGNLYGFHFISGVQEAIFDSGRFAFASDSLRRVAERFIQIPIDRTDVKYVISERLLKKSPDQIAKIQKHLSKFTKCFEDLTGRMDEFTRMFPVHPDFVSIFERIECVEKRRILDTLSAKMKELIEDEVPEDAPGLIAFDSYWRNVKGDPTSKTNSDIRSVIDSVNQLDGKIEHGDLKKMYKPMAHRIVDALAVHRLSTDSLDSHIGMTAKEMREMLFLYDPMCAEESDPALALQDQIKVVITKLMTAVDGQYISRNLENDQYYIDVKKTVDVEQLIVKRAETLNDEDRDRAYYEALSIILEVKEVPTATQRDDFKIWQYDKIRWFSHRTFRRGYLFFGAPNERSTAQPPRDYYIYFLRPFVKVPFKDEHKADEVFFTLEGVDDSLKQSVSNYAAAIQLRGENSNAMKNAFEQRSIAYLKAIQAWLLGKGLGAFSVTYRGNKHSPKVWLQGVNLRDLLGISSNEPLNLRDQLIALSSHLLEPYFTDQAKEYPSFSRYISADARPAAIKEALRMLNSGSTRQAIILLDGLKLLDNGEALSTENSPYADGIRVLMEAAGDGKVINRSDLLKNVADVPYYAPDRFRLEPELLVLVLGTMVATGEITLAISGKVFTAMDLKSLGDCDLNDLMEFKYIARPKNSNAEGIKAAFRLLGLPQGLVAQLSQLKPEPVQQFQTKLATTAGMAAQLIGRLGRGISFLGQDLLAQCGLAGVSASVREAKDLLDKLDHFNTPAKMLALPMTADELNAQAETVALLPNLQRLVEFCDGHLVTVSNLDSAAEHCQDEDPWKEEYDQTYTAIRTDIVQCRKLEEVRNVLNDADGKLKKLEVAWRTHYEQLHQRARLTADEDIARQRIRNSAQLKKLNDLSAITIIPKADLENLRQQLDQMRLCREFKPTSLASSALCPFCHYSPKSEGTGSTASAVLAAMPQQLELMLEKWTELLLTNLKAPESQKQLELLTAEERQAVSEFQDSHDLPQPIPLPLLSGLKKALGGLEKLVVRGADLVQRLKVQGPCEPQKLQQAFQSYLEELLNGRDVEKVRIVIED